MLEIKNEENDNYLLFFFLILTQIWNAKFDRHSLLFFFLLLSINAI